MKPILFNEEMVRAILEGRKTATRRAIKPQPDGGRFVMDCDEEEHTFDIMCGNGGTGGVFADWANTVKAPFWPGDILYVREKWRIHSGSRFDSLCKIEFAAAGPLSEIQFAGKRSQSISREEYDQFIDKWYKDGWNPSIFMPKEAARIFLKVTDVHPERLWDITPEQALKEGCSGVRCDCSGAFVAGGITCCVDCLNTGWVEPPTLEFFKIWDGTIKKADKSKFGYEGNPWVWVIEFEQTELRQ